MAFAEYSIDELNRMFPLRDKPDGPTERQLQWMREKIPGFATAERQALSARAAKREAAG